MLYGLQEVLDYRTTYIDDIDVSQYRIMLIIHNLKSY